MSQRSDLYPVALSYASEDEALVKAVYRHLRSRNIDAFFAPTKTSHLWGKDEREFERIYGPGSRYVVPFISDAYIQKEWPRFEFRAARREARKRREEFILPVRIDDSVLPGLRKKTQYVDARHHSPKQIATLLIEKLEADVRTTETGDASTGAHVRPRVLADEERELLGLIATATYPLRIASVRSLIPQAKWDPYMRQWRTHGYITTDLRGFIHAEPVLHRQLLRDRAAVTRWRERWVTLLDPLRGHTDTALMLGLQLIGLRRISEAVGVFASIAIGLEPGIWNRIYLRTFEALAKSPLLRAAEASARVEFHNAYGVVLSRHGAHADALVQFAKVRALSRRTGNIGGEGQSYINAGVAAADAGDVPAAIAWYERAAAFGKKHRDYVLAGRAIGNIANFVDPASASELLQESERLKIRSGDVVGLAGTAVVRGNVAAVQRNFAEAVQHYRRAIHMSKRLDLRHVRAVALRNLARIEVDRGRPKKAYAFYQESARICRQEGFTADHAYAVAGEALAHMNAREFARAGKLFEALAELHRDAGQRQAAAIARHDVGTMLAMRGRAVDAYRIFTDVIREFETLQVGDWVRRTQVDAAAVAPDEETATSLLTAARRTATTAKDYETLQRATVQLAGTRLDRDDVEGAIHALDLALRALPPPLDVPFLADRFRLILETGRDRRIAPAFNRLVASARSAGDRERVIDAHMELGDHLWAKGSIKEGVNAYEAYAVAMTEAVQLDSETSPVEASLPPLTVLLKVGIHVFHIVFGAARNGDPNVLTGLEKPIHDWFQTQDARYAQRLSQFALWPVRLAARVYGLPSHGRRLSQREIEKILTEELQAALRTTPSTKQRKRAREIALATV